MTVLKMFLGMLFGWGFETRIDQRKIKKEDQEQLFNKDVLSKLNECQSSEEQKDIFNNYILINIRKNFNATDQKDIETRFNDTQKLFRDRKFMRKMIDDFIKYFEKNI